MPIPGLDYLALAHPKWPIKDSVRALPKVCAVGAFDTPLFGKLPPNLKALLNEAVSQGKQIVAVRIHIWWSYQHAIAPLEIVIDRAKFWEQFSKQYKHIKFYLSHSCEHRELDLATVNSRIKAIKQYAPSCIPVNSVAGGALIPGVINERHGRLANLSPKYIVSTDGINSYDINSTGYHKDHADAEIVFDWGSRFNLREIPDPGQPIPPINQRNATPSLEYLQGVARITQPMGTPIPPKLGKQAIIVPFKSTDLWKTFAEDDQETNPNEPDDPRENRPCYIASNTYGQIVNVVASNRVIVARLRFGGVFGNNQRRYYSGLGDRLAGFQMGNKARQASGSEFVYLSDDMRRFVGPIHPAFRAGYFQQA